MGTGEFFFGKVIKHSTMADPLQLLREYTVQGKEITYDESTKELIFGNQKFSKDFVTELKAKNTQPHTLGALWFFSLHFIRDDTVKPDLGS